MRLTIRTLFLLLFSLSFLLFLFANKPSTGVSHTNYNDKEREQVLKEIREFEISQRKVIPPANLSQILGLEIKYDILEQINNTKERNNPREEYVRKEKRELFEFLKSQFLPYKETGITSEMVNLFDRIDKRDVDNYLLMRVKIKGQKVFIVNEIDHDRMKIAKKVLGEFMALHGAEVPDVDFIMTGHDALHVKQNSTLKNLLDGVPLFVMSRGNLTRNKHIAIPDFYQLERNDHLHVFLPVSEASQKINWEEKKGVAFWRGSSTGQPILESGETVHDALRLARFKLAYLSNAYPYLLDAKITHFVQVPWMLTSQLKEFYREGMKVPHLHHLNYKYLVSVDGNSCSWMRVPWILVSNSLLIKQETYDFQWFYPAMKPYVHYVPVKMDLSDLVEKVEWCKENDEIVKEISKRATEFAMANLKYLDGYEHLLFILKEYSSLQRFQVL